MLLIADNDEKYSITIFSRKDAIIDMEKSTWRGQGFAVKVVKKVLQPPLRSPAPILTSLTL
ncbi:MAG TPA: hypothetical protein DDZ88_29255 [Verrucomicrobiales bacterium]|nr:hypothetical protein [Verrucomicrobiales bacterium]